MRKTSREMQNKKKVTAISIGLAVILLVLAIIAVLLFLCCAFKGGESDDERSNFEKNKASESESLLRDNDNDDYNDGN